jgi:hypothetical protein
MYAEMPDTKGAFAVEKLAADKGTFSLYEIHSTPDANNGTVAKLTLCQNPQAHQRALVDHRSFLFPACNYSDLPSDNNAVSPTQISAGRVKLDGDRWVVEDKIVIQFTS